jgi:hypothetical protein
LNESKDTYLKVSFFSTQTEQNHQRLSQCFPVEVVSLKQQTCQLSAAPTISFVCSENTLFLANNGKAYKPGKLSELTSRYIRLAGIKHFGACHLFRHITATAMLDNGADLRMYRKCSVTPVFPPPRFTPMSADRSSKRCI